MSVCVTCGTKHESIPDPRPPRAKVGKEPNQQKASRVEEVEGYSSPFNTDPHAWDHRCQPGVLRHIKRTSFAAFCLIEGETSCGGSWSTH